MGNKIGVPASGRHLVDVLEKGAPYNESEEDSESMTLSGGLHFG